MTSRGRYRPLRSSTRSTSSSATDHDEAPTAVAHERLPRHVRLPSSAAVARTPWLRGANAVLLCLGGAALAAPTNRLFEAAVSRRFYHEHPLSNEVEGDDGGGGQGVGSDIPEEACKCDEIQAALALAFAAFKVSSKMAGESVSGRSRVRS